MAILSENMVYSKTRSRELWAIKQLNCWGSDLTDISIIRQMSNVQVLSLSVNSISSLADFASCKNLVELYLRENRIKDLGQIVHLQELVNLRKLWLAGNPCADVPNYRLIVLKALPNLEMLDNVPVTSDEIERAEDLDIDGTDLSAPQPPPPSVSSDRRDSIPPNQQQQRQAISDDDSEEQYSECSNSHGGGAQDPLLPTSPGSANGHSQAGHRNSSASIGSNSHHPQRQPSYPEVQWIGIAPAANGGASPQQQNHQQTRPPPPHLTEVNSPTGMVRSSSIQDQQAFNGSRSTSQLNLSPNAAHAANGNGYYQDQDGGSAHSAYNRPSTGSASKTNGSYQQQHRLSAVPKGGKRRQHANILSAVLCLIQELDLASLEIVDTEIHGRMDELSSN